MKGLQRWGFERRRNFVIAEVLPIYIQLVGEYEELVSFCMKSVTTNSGKATIVNLTQHQDFWSMAIENPANRLTEILGEPLPMEAIPTNGYKGRNRMFMTTLRTSILEGESLNIKVNLLSNSKPTNITMNWRAFGASDYSKIPLENLSRGIFTTTLGADIIKGKDFEYYIEAEFDRGDNIIYPAAAKDINNTVIIVDHP